MVVGLDAHTRVYVEAGVLPRHHRTDRLKVQQPLVEEQIEHLVAPDIFGPLQIHELDRHEAAVLREDALCTPRLLIQKG
jgi:hypothetical protein